MKYLNRVKKKEKNNHKGHKDFRKGLEETPVGIVFVFFVPTLCSLWLNRVNC
jgi:hypothetical protein